MSDIFLKAYHGGLGDNLQFSTLPEEFAKQQNKKTYILESASFRNQEIYDLIWGKNPYILGRKEGNWNAGDLPEIKNQNIHDNCILNWEYHHGLKPTNRYPKIYYDPKFISKHKDTILVDLSSISIDYDKSQIQLAINNYRKEFKTKKFVSISFKNTPTKDKFNNYSIELDDNLIINDIFEYCDAIISAFAFIALSSGSSHLSSALKAYNPDLKSICLMDRNWFNFHKKNGRFIFDNIQYHII